MKGGGRLRLAITRCDVLSENACCKLMSEHLVPSWWNCLERLDGTALLERCVTSGWALRFQRTSAIPSMPSLSHTCRSRPEILVILVTIPLLHHHKLKPSENISPIKCFLLSVALLMACGHRK